MGFDVWPLTVDLLREWLADKPGDMLVYKHNMLYGEYYMVEHPGDMAVEHVRKPSGRREDNNVVRLCPESEADAFQVVVIR